MYLDDVMDKYKFRKYNSKFKRYFELEKNKIEKSLGKNLKIEHVGSTAVPGLGGKGIIDIAIKTPKNKLNQFMNKLERLGYKPNLEHRGNNKRVFLQKIIRYSGKERRIHIHLTLNNNFWDSFIVFRDYLRSHDKERDKYSRIKKEATILGLKGKEYRDYKEKFIKEVLR